MRFYVSPESVVPEKNIIEIKDREEIHHIRDVMRLGQGDSISVFDGTGKEYTGEIRRATRNLVLIHIDKIQEYNSVLPVKLTLYQAIPRQHRMELVIEKATELGVDKIIPVITERTLGTPPGERQHIKKERWSRIARAAAKQSGRTKLPFVSGPMVFPAALAHARNDDLVILAALDRCAAPLKSILKGSSPKTVSVFVGPEGDFSPAEISMAGKLGYNICSLGSLILRTETAAIYILSCLIYEYK